jgi:Iap family predicted aminopeptidase
MFENRMKQATVAVVVAAIIILSVVLAAFVLSPAKQSRPATFQEVSDNIDIVYAREVVENITTFGTMTGINGEFLGFRTAGSSASIEASEYVRDQMGSIGLTNVTMEEVPLDSWELKSAWVNIPGIGKMQAISHGGSGNTSSSPHASPNGSITAEIVNVGNGGKSDYVGKDVSGKIVLSNFNSKNLWTNTMALEAEFHGAIAIVFTTYDNWETIGMDIEYGLNGTAIVAMDGEYKPSYIPVLSISGNDGRRIIEKINTTVGNLSVTIYSDIRIKTMEEGAYGYNVVGYLPGKNWGEANDEMLIIGDHTDSWFYGAFDDAGGVGATLALAKAFKEAYDVAGSKPNRTMVFITHEAEEWGRFGTYYDWIWGANYEITEIHPEWAGKTVANIIMDYIGLRGEPFGVEVTPELRSFAENVTADHSAIIPNDVQFLPVSTYEDHWPYAAAGIPSLSCWTWSTTNYEKYYHTQLDTIDVLDFDYMRDNLVVISDMAFRLVNCQVLPYDFSLMADDLNYAMLDSPSYKVSQLAPVYQKYGIDMGVNLNRTLDALEEFSDLTEQLEDLLSAYRSRYLTEEKQEDINSFLLETAKLLDSSLLSIGVWNGAGYFPYTQSLIDTYYLSNAIDTLSGSTVLVQIETATTMLTDWVGINWYYNYMSEPTYREQYNITFIEGKISFGKTQHLLPAVDVWDEVDRLKQMIGNGSVEAANLLDIVSDLKGKQTDQAFANLEAGLSEMWAALEDTNANIAAFLDTH